MSLTEKERISTRHAMLVPINSAEAFISVFFDPLNPTLPYWDVEPGDVEDFSITQTWANVQVRWMDAAPGALAMRMRRVLDVDCSNYDRLILRHSAEGTRVRLTAETDAGPRTTEYRWEAWEGLLDLDGAQRLDALTIELFAVEPAQKNVHLIWVGLQSTERLPAYLDQWAHYEEHWPGLMHEDHKPTFEPSYGILITKDELEQARVRHDAAVAEGKTSLFAKWRDDVAGWRPEDEIGQFTGGDHRFSRDRDLGRRMFHSTMPVAMAGLVLRDENLLRLAARSALSLAVTPILDIGPSTHFPLSPWEARAFRQARIAEDLASALDLVGEYFTRTGKELIERKLAEHALGFTNFVVWKHEYIHDCNQLAGFSVGRVLAYVMLERVWPRVAPYTDLAIQELLDSLRGVILPDGGFVEGPSYFFYTMHTAGRALYFYARQRGKPLAEVMPREMLNTPDFAEATASTVPEQDVVPLCDGKQYCNMTAVALLANAMPDSYWTTMYRDSYARRGETPLNPCDVALEPSVPEQGPPLRPFIMLPELRLAASNRAFEGEPVKLLFLGNRADSGHTHEDKGSFVLEFARDTFAADPGMTDYGKALSWELKQCQRHNMLVPYGLERRPAPENKLPYHVTPEAEGDATRFAAHMDVSPGWGGLYTRWERRLDSPTPDVLTIHDAWELESGDGVEFYWQTFLDMTLDGTEAVITGRRGRVRIAVPDGVEARIDELPWEDKVQRRLAFRVPKRAGELTVTARMERLQG